MHVYLSYRLTSQRSLPISVAMYQPLKGAAVNSSPPQSNAMLATAGSAYHFNPNSSNQGNLDSEISVSNVNREIGCCLFLWLLWLLYRVVGVKVYF